MKRCLGVRSMLSWLSSMMRRPRPSSPNELAPEFHIDSLLEYRERTFYVVFSDSKKYVWSPFLCRGFMHCYVIEKLEMIWCVCDPTRIGLNITLPYCTSEHPLIEKMMQIAPDIRVLEVVTRGTVGSFLLKPKIMSCVSVVQYVMGTSFFLCMTPYSLFKKLLKCKHENMISVKEIHRDEHRGKPGGE